MQELNSYSDEQLLLMEAERIRRLKNLRALAQIKPRDALAIIKSENRGIQSAIPDSSPNESIDNLFQRWVTRERILGKSLSGDYYEDGMQSWVRAICEQLNIAYNPQKYAEHDPSYTKINEPERKGVIVAP